MWSAWDCYLTAARDVLGLQLPFHEKYKYWERASQLGGFRIMHTEFCMVCEFPVVLKVDDRNRPHREDGPSHLWKDGWALHYFHGVKVPAYVIERPDQITVAKIEAETNLEVRRVMIQRYGYDRYIKDSGAKLVHELPDNYFVKGLQGAKLWRKDREGDTPVVAIECLNSTPEPDGSIKRYMIRVQPDAYDGLASKDCHAAMASTYRNKADDSLFFKKPQDYRPGFES